MECRVCGNTANNDIYEAREMQLGLRETFTYFQCANCKCLQIAEVPSDLSKYYPKDYYSFNISPKKLYEGLKGKLRKMRYAATIFNNNPLIKSLFPTAKYELIAQLNIGRHDKILDVGCGAGYFLYALAELGFREILGVDPFIAGNIAYENGLEIHQKSVHEVQGQWDLIMYHHAFEHVTDPLENLIKIQQLLTPEGVCLLRIPTVSSYAWEHYGVNWFQLDAPRHIFLHSIESMKVLAEKAGLELFEVVYDSNDLQFIASEKYAKNIPLTENAYKGLKGKLKKKLDKRKYRLKAKQLNKEQRGDQAAFLLRPKP